MKKLILATAIAALTATTAASAATMYEKDGMTLDLQGDLQIQALQGVGADQDVDVDYDDLELELGAKYSLGNGMTAFGHLGLDWKDQADGTDDSIVGEAYLGLQAGPFKASLGRQYWGSDDFGVEKAIELGGENAFPDTGGAETVKLSYNASRFGVTLSHDLEDDGVDENGDPDDASATDLMLTTKLGRAEVGVVYQDYQENSATDSIDTLGVMASFNVGRANVGVDYSTNDDASFTNAALGFPIRGAASGSIGATLEDQDGADEIVHWYANATKNLHKNVSVFAEIGDNDADNTDLGYVAGMQIKF